MNGTKMIMFVLYIVKIINTAEIKGKYKIGRCISQIFFFGVLNLLIIVKVIVIVIIML